MNCKKIITIVIIAIIAMSSIIVELNAKEVNTASFTLMPGSSRISPVYGFITKTAGNGMTTIPFAHASVSVTFYAIPNTSGSTFTVSFNADENGYYHVPIFIDPDEYEKFSVIIDYFHYSPEYSYTGGHRLDIRVDQAM